MGMLSFSPWSLLHAELIVEGSELLVVHVVGAGLLRFLRGFGIGMRTALLVFLAAEDRHQNQINSFFVIIILPPFAPVLQG